MILSNERQKTMSSQTYQNLTITNNGPIYIITLKKPPENRINSHFAQEIIRALRDVEKRVGEGQPGAVITRGEGEKFWSTGLDLDEVDVNPFANSDGFYPVRTIFFFNVINPFIVRWTKKINKCTEN
jgi:Delta3-Delta2-enoyl-CoA isomerase